MAGRAVAGGAVDGGAADGGAADGGAADGGAAGATVCAIATFRAATDSRSQNGSMCLMGFACYFKPSLFPAASNSSDSTIRLSRVAARFAV